MSIFITVIHIIVCFVLIAVILLQAGRGQGFGGTFGGGEGTQTIFGTRSADFLSKATTVCAILFLFTCIGLDVLEARKGRSLFETSPKLESEDLKVLQDALKELEAKEAAEKTAAGANVTQSISEQTTPASESEAAAGPASTSNETPSLTAEAPPKESSADKPVT
ncbi:MAG: preprotein translocase subunit SecG [Candidatus Omnitrophica bacterium]|nr:preprotein translocase subunit SecG [Candidatus Omnitrophota bacterium]